jgi:TrmH family RNA methyltransferase|tara:strand:- start:9462 stop:10205 length:744 start_codon:yes stop_codon:yes gene_type:complete
LFKNNKRKASNSFIVEGKKNINLCHDFGFKFIEIIICSEIISDDNINYINNNYKNIIIYDFSLSLYQELIYKKKSDGLLALVKSKDNSLESFKISKNPYILIAESPEKPGNIGALLRTADAAGLDGLIIANPKTELYNPNAIRSSLGSIFTMQIATASTDEIIRFLKKNNIKIFSTFVENSKNYLNINYKQACAIIVGTESSSLSKSWLLESDELISIPMKGEMDSLNLSVSAAIVIFEGLKQRNDN